MSRDLYVTAFRDMDGTFARMLEIKQFCDEKHVSYPKEVTDYFGEYVSPSDSETKLAEELGEINVHDKLRRWHDTDGYGYEIDMADIPKEVKTLRFYVS